MEIASCRILHTLGINNRRSSKYHQTPLNHLHFPPLLSYTCRKSFNFRGNSLQFKKRLTASGSSLQQNSSQQLAVLLEVEGLVIFWCYVCVSINVCTYRYPYAFGPTQVYMYRQIWMYHIFSSSFSCFSSLQCLNLAYVASFVIEKLWESNLACPIFWGYQEREREMVWSTLAQPHRIFPKLYKCDFVCLIVLYYRFGKCDGLGLKIL